MTAYVRDPDDDSEQILWDIDAADGFGPNSAVGSRAPPAGRVRDQHERTTVHGDGP